MSKKFHIAASGKNAGYYVECKAQHVCALQYSDGSQAKHTLDEKAAHKHNTNITRQVEAADKYFEQARRSARFGQKVERDTGKTKFLTTEQRQQWLQELNVLCAENQILRYRLAGIPVPKTPDEAQNELDVKIRGQIEAKEGYYYDKFLDNQKEKHRQEVFSITTDPIERMKLAKEWMLEDAEKQIVSDAAAPVLGVEDVERRKRFLDAAEDRTQALHDLNKSYGFADSVLAEERFMKSNPGFVAVDDVASLGLTNAERYVTEAHSQGWKVFCDDDGVVKMCKFSPYHKGLYVLVVDQSSPVVGGYFVRTKIGTKMLDQKVSLVSNMGMKTDGPFIVKAVQQSLNVDRVSGERTDFNTMSVYDDKVTSLRNLFKARKHELVFDTGWVK